MKKIVTAIAIIALITGCAKNDISDTLPKDGSLVFSLSTSNAQNTRTAELSNNLLESKANIRGRGIALYAYQNANSTWNKWFTDELTYNSGWGINSIRFTNVNQTRYVSYWPLATQSSMLTEVGTTFADAHFTPGSYPQFVYNINHNDGSPDDLVAAVTSVDAGRQSVNIQMRHLLSQINFAVMGGSGKEITIKNIGINGVYSTATYTFDGNGTGVPGEWGNYGWTDNFEGGTFYPAQPGYGYAYDLSAGTTVPANATGAVYVLGDGGNAAVGTGAYYWNGTAWGTGFTPSNGVKPTGLSNSLMVLPQRFVDSNPDDTEIVIEYTIDGGAISSFQNIPLNSFNIDWQQGMRYVYLFEYVPAGDNFDITVSITPWGEPNAIPITGVRLMPSQGAMDAGTGSTVSINGELLDDEVWDMTDYAFTGIANIPSSTIRLDFSNCTSVESKTITLILPDGITATQTTISPDGTTQTVTITNNAFYNDAAALQSAVETTTNSPVFGFCGNGSAIDLTGYDMSTIAPGASVAVTFLANIPSSTYTNKMTPASNWSWNAVTYTATYTSPVNGAIVMPTLAQMNGMFPGQSWYLASAGKYAPPASRTATFSLSSIWDFVTAGHTFPLLTNIGDKFTFNFSNVTFGGNSLTLRVPLGFAMDVDAYSGATTVITTGSSVTVTNKTTYSNSVALQTAVTSGTYTNGVNFGYIANATNIDLTDYDMSAAGTANRITVAFFDWAPQNALTAKMSPRSPTSLWWWNSSTKRATYMNTTANTIPTAGHINAIESGGGITFAASTLVAVQAWDISGYAFTQLAAGGSFTLNFSNVDFNIIPVINPLGYTIALTLPAGYTAVGVGVTIDSLPNTYIIATGASTVMIIKP